MLRQILKRLKKAASLSVCDFIHHHQCSICGNYSECHRLNNPTRGSLTSRRGAETKPILVKEDIFRCRSCTYDIFTAGMRNIGMSTD